MTKNEKQTPDLRKVEEALVTVVYSGSLDGVIPVDMSAMLKEALTELQAYMDRQEALKVELVTHNEAAIKAVKGGVMADCKHIVTQSRQGEKGSFCNSCSFKRLSVHDRPCGECKYHKDLGDGSVCIKHLMRVSRDMYVTYKNFEDGTNDLCFETLEPQQEDK